MNHCCFQVGLPPRFVSGGGGMVLVLFLKGKNVLTPTLAQSDSTVFTKFQVCTTNFGLEWLNSVNKIPSVSKEYYKAKKPGRFTLRLRWSPIRCPYKCAQCPLPKCHKVDTTNFDPRGSEPLPPHSSPEPSGLTAADAFGAVLRCERIFWIWIHPLPQFVSY